MDGVDKRADVPRHVSQVPITAVIDSNLCFDTPRLLYINLHDPFLSSWKESRFNSDLFVVSASEEEQGNKPVTLTVFLLSKGLWWAWERTTKPFTTHLP